MHARTDYFAEKKKNPVTAIRSLADPRARAELEKALENPEKWTIYLMPEKGEKRTEAQNRLYHRLLSKFAQKQGRSVKWWHHHLVETYLGYEEVINEDGYVRQWLPSTSSLSVAEFSDFLNACLVLAMDNDVI